MGKIIILYNYISVRGALMNNRNVHYKNELLIRAGTIFKSGLTIILSTWSHFCTSFHLLFIGWMDIYNACSYSE
ncbi:hypothetical protein SLEP1_g33794 [Rubroshorea leprosula]|uniref:Uncharacterized protein n=1 Tax=Rubroshorea leprosula TaxID=152421 RepID=A0AAV5KHR8_9ROSI|nr:hypothetical protein SLEP1_g33794 [Rubroshorea leprosula]